MGAEIKSIINNEQTTIRILGRRITQQNAGEKEHTLGELISVDRNPAMPDTDVQIRFYDRAHYPDKSLGFRKGILEPMLTGGIPPRDHTITLPGESTTTWVKSTTTQEKRLVQR